MLEYNVDIQKIMQNQQKKAENGGGRWLCMYCTCVCLRIRCVQLVLG